ncbi:VCBS repeat-containing protein [Pseudozobellia thermophila]|uniref:Repeat domain-containing protein n=1 Tax=Pseudozobellia thermophila TaxID=192903 RepID=A0A1M6CFC8_9FLAO|nr:VCBS repeat-containing protein [Pseudozobellia thermophila]SHI59702.1 Repeat domain-containing protein [Pseudozobellia thermophila]
MYTSLNSIHGKLAAIVLCVVLISCNTEKEKKTPFKRLSSDHTHIKFNNLITENEVLNILDYEYIYNGGGVGIGDFNSDGLPDICFTGNMVSSRIYLNQGNLQFKDITAEAGLITDKWCSGVSVVDINNDGKPDIHIATSHDLDLGHTENYFFINRTGNDGQVKFENKAEEMNLAHTSYSIQAVWLDYDQDGDLDMFLANNSKEEYPKNNPFGQKKDGSGKSTDRLFRNEGSKGDGVPVFTDVSDEAGITIEGWTLGVAVLDINHDGLSDIYVANDFLSNDILYVNNGDGTFSNRITQYFKHQSHNSMGIDIADINNDSLQDVLVLDMLPEDNLRKKTMFPEIPFDRFTTSIRMGYQPQFVRNVLQINNGPSPFSDIGYLAGVAETDWSWSPLIADFDNDGLRDIYITNGYRKDITDMDFVDFYNSMNVAGPAEEKESRLREQLKSMEGIKKSNFFFRNSGSNTFSDETKNAGLFLPSYSNGAAYADLDLDGDLDLVANNINDEALIFENRLADTQHPNSNYLRIAFEPNAENIGAKAWVYSRSGLKYAEFYPHKGYLSTFEPALHFGLGSDTQVDSLYIQWPDGRTSRYENLRANLLLKPEKQGKKTTIPTHSKGKDPVFTEVKGPNKPTYLHSENLFDDFKKWPLIFRGYSKPGPIIVSGDINGDALDDLFIGGTANNDNFLYLQDPTGGFREHSLARPSDVLPAECSGASLFDADNDGDLDLYIAHGSSENYSNMRFYQDLLYLNDGEGNFSLKEDGLPKIEYPTNTVVPFDMDQDGDLDLFVGGRLDPNNYPFSPKSYILENDGGVFTDATNELAPHLDRLGMVSDARAGDIDNDSWVDLVIVGDWMPITVLKNRNGRMEFDVSENQGLEQSHGWWNCIEMADFDKDGDLDFVVGNWGLNNPFDASVQEPLSIYAKDFDNNGTVEPIFTQYIEGREYIVHSRGTLVKQLPLLRKLTKNYEDYGKKSFPELFDTKNIDPKSIFRTYELASVYVENLGNGSFAYTPLPIEAQRAPLMDLSITDLNADGLPDILGVGNYTDTEVLTGHYDAGNGISLINPGNGTFKVLGTQESGFSVPEEARTLIDLNTADHGKLWIVGLQNDSLKTFRKTPRKEMGPILP